jgi:hypothetical protein
VTTMPLRTHSNRGCGCHSCLGRHIFCAFVWVIVKQPAKRTDVTMWSLLLPPAAAELPGACA